MSSAVERLAVIVDHSDGAGDILEWVALEHAYGHEFPVDYQEFVAALGEGSFNEDGLMVAIPRVPQDERWRVHRLPDDTVTAPDMQSWAQSERAGRYLLRDILVWGGTGTGDVLCWLTEESSPDQWPVAVWSRASAAWEVYECGMVEFLIRVFTAEFEECPISDVAVWGTRPQFLHALEEERLREAGLNPWTGALDPFAGLQYE
ncbi:SMI1/KNR4 family protein [Streptomyces melanogenes]|uniref:SMI1/KNR4 family protein n=1 Tax=Streptomyces melanogenes TaxID=67326 RepID=UPI003798DED7